MRARAIANPVSILILLITSVTLGAAAAPATAWTRGDLDFTDTWTYGVFGNRIGECGFVAADVDDDGAIEIVCGGATSTFGMDVYWYIVEQVPATGAYEIEWISGIYSAGINAIVADDPDGDGVFRIIIGLGDGELRVFDGATREQIEIIAAPLPSVSCLVFADADNDGANELLVGEADRILLYDAVTLVYEGEIVPGADRFAVGDVDGDPAQEIVFASGFVLEYDGAILTVEWDYSVDGFGALVALSDFDGDGMAEIVGAEQWYYITAFDADLMSPKWQVNAGLDIDALLLADVDDDLVDEVLYADRQHGEVHCLDAVTTVQDWEIPNPSSGVTEILVADVDDDPALEILWGCGSNTTGEDHLLVYELPSLAEE